MAINVSGPRVERVAVACRSGVFDPDHSQMRQRSRHASALPMTSAIQRLVLASLVAEHETPASYDASGNFVPSEKPAI
jgi:hypothetical protein